MAEATIVASLVKLIPEVWKLLKEEWDHSSEAKMELENLDDLIGAIGRFLKKANSKEVNDEDLKASMKRMRRFLHDSEDAIHDFMKKKKCKLEGLAVYIYKHITHQTFASEAKSIRQMVENYKTTLEISTKLSADHAKSSLACHQSLSIAFSDERDHELVGIERAREQLVGWLTDDSPTRKVIFVHGAQGVGKTSLVGAVLRDEKMRNLFSYYVWIRSCELVDSKAALMKANAEIWVPTEKDSLGFQLELEGVFRSLWNENIKWALILDDAGSAHVFESLRNLLARTRPSVLVTTQDSSLESNSRFFLDSQTAQFVGAPLKPLYDIHHFKLLPLSSEDSSTLFCRKMFQMDVYPDGLADFFHSIVQQCRGLPLSILAASNLLSYVGDGVNGTPGSVVWKKLSGRFGEALLSKGHKSDLIRRMTTLRMDHFHDVRACLFYLSIFPLDCPVSCSRLMRLWMAERFIEQKGTTPVQTIAEDVLKKLVDHNLFQEVKKTNYERAKTCLIYNILHQIIISKSKDDEFAMIVGDPEEGWPETVWRLSIHNKMASIKTNTRVQRLRSLLVFGQVYPDSMEALLKQVSRLNVLDIQDCSLGKFPGDILLLRYLRYLRLRGAGVTEIPDGIGKLKHLETLDLKDTSVTKLPGNILKLTALRHLLVYKSDRSPYLQRPPKQGVEAPLGLGVLTSLQKLCLIDLKQDKVNSKLLEELKKLKNLRRLGISNLRRNHMENLCSSIGMLTKLEALHLLASKDYNGSLDLSKVNKSKEFPFLQRVHLTGYMSTLPNWLLAPSLVKLFMRKSKLREDAFQQLKSLPCLKHLDLQDESFDLREMKIKERDFQQLRFLKIDSFPNLKSIIVEEKALPALAKLILSRCEKLTEVPQHVPLKCLLYYKMSDAWMTALKTAERQNPEDHAHELVWQEPGVVDIKNDQLSSRRPVRNGKWLPRCLQWH